MAETTPASYSSDPTLYLYTSLTAGSSHIVTATSRLETILKANRIPFRALDVATDEKARMLWGRRSKGKKLPGLVRYGMIVGDLEEVEEWNEYGELKQQIGGTGPAVSKTPSTSTTNTPSKAPDKIVSSTGTPSEKPLSPAPSHDSATKHINFKDSTAQKDTPAATPTTKEEPSSVTLALRQAGAEAAKKAEEKKAEKNAAFKASLSKPKDEETNDSSTPDPAPPSIVPTPSQVRGAPSPKPEAGTIEPSPEAKGSDKPTIETEPSLVESPSPQQTVSASLGGDPPPLHYSPKATPAVSSTSSIGLNDKAEGAGSGHHREESVIAEAPKEIIEQVESQQAIPEVKEEEKEEVKASAPETGAPTEEKE